MKVVLTGWGAITPLGASPQAMAEAVRRGQTPFVPSPWGYPVAPAPSPNVRALVGPMKNARYLCRAGRLAVAAAVQAVADAGLAPPLSQAALFLGLGPHLEATPPQALWLLSAMPSTTTSLVAATLGIHGESATLLGACAASTQALAWGARAIAEGRTAVALVGGADSRVGERAVAAYASAGVLAPADIRPFDTERSGFIPAEGAAMMVLESEEHARGRGARILASVLGTGIGIDGRELTDPNPETMAPVVRGALEGTAVDPSQLLVLAHGTGTRAGDAAEAAMLEAELGSDFPGAVTALKSWLGHGAAACGLMELALFFACRSHGFVPPVRGLATPCARLPFMRACRPWQPRLLLVESFGFGGQAAAVLMELTHALGSPV
ncbi:MAG: beta-ketoacyl synthase N-terminal-like domain-containing protein [Desulfomicrobiaceae bacterium]